MGVKREIFTFHTFLSRLNVLDYHKCLLHFLKSNPDDGLMGHLYFPQLCVVCVCVCPISSFKKYQVS